MSDVLAGERLVERAQAVRASAPLKDAASVLVSVIHAVHDSLGFRLVEPSLDGDGRLPEGTTKLTYKHDTSSFTFIISVVTMGGRLLVAGSGVDEQKSHTFDLLVSDYFSASALPLQRDTSIQQAFASMNRLNDLVSLYRINILQPLFPGLRKEGYSELSSAETGTATSSSTSSQASRGYLPDSEGPMGPYGGASPSRLQQPPRHDPLSIGARDLDPLGGIAPPSFPGFPGSRGPLIGGGPGSGSGSEGMLVGHDHPLFRERFGHDGLAHPRSGGGDGRRWGGDGFLPPGAAPPGARFDPVGPYNGPPGGFGPGRGPQGGGPAPFRGGAGSFPRPPGSGNVGGPGGAEPDWDGERPPRGDSDYDMMFG